jgi:putative tryptophan/tyrosine transport system substrate-binding protein
MNRRTLMTLIGGAAAWPVVARAQQPGIPVVGYLHQNPHEGSDDLVAEFRKGLSENGYIEGRNVAMEFRWAEGALERLPELAADLVQRRVTVIATPGSFLAARAAKAATATLPIVFGGGGDPVQAGLVASLNRPGGNATGFVELNTDTASKRLELLHDLMPRASHFAFLVEPNSAGITIIPGLQATASAVGVKVEALVAAGTDRTVDAAFAELGQKRIDALIVSPSALFYSLRERLAAAATRYAIPVIYWDRALVEAGGLMSYGSSVTEMFHQVGIYTSRILRGEKPADMPVMQATKFELVINLKAAKAIGLTISPSLLARADEVIE